MFRFAVIPQSFAVIGDERDHGAIDLAGFRSSAETMRAMQLSTYAISPSYGDAGEPRAKGAGASYGACASYR